MNGLKLLNFEMLIKKLRHCFQKSRQCLFSCGNNYFFAHKNICYSFKTSILKIVAKKKTLTRKNEVNVFLLNFILPTTPLSFRV